MNRLVKVKFGSTKMKESKWRLLSYEKKRKSLNTFSSGRNTILLYGSIIETISQCSVSPPASKYFEMVVSSKELVHRKTSENDTTLRYKTLR